MQYRRLGQSGLKVSKIAVGSWMTDLSKPEALEQASEVIRCAFEQGVNFFDCADGYSGGEAERFLGKTLSQYPRRELVLSSKVFFPTGKGINDRGLSRKHIMESLEQSLRNMKTDYLDLYFCHRFDPETPVEETLRALDDLVHQGKILYYGVSEWMPAQIQKALGIIKGMCLYPLTVVQPQYNRLIGLLRMRSWESVRKMALGSCPFLL